MGTAYGLGEEYGISAPGNLVKGLAYVRIANSLEGFCKCTDTSLLFEAARPGVGPSWRTYPHAE
eukprot:SAG31_NODE_922_length_10976_cov_8.838742_9_plen_64_part_00